MQRRIVTVVSVAEIARQTIKMVVQDEYISKYASPGQFVHIAVRNHTLRRPISIASVNKTEQTFTLLFKIIGSGTEQLANSRVSDTLDMLGPNGNGFPLDEIRAGEKLLLVGGGIGVPPLHFLAERLQQYDVDVHAILGFQTEDYVFFQAEFAQLSHYTIVTADGTYGEKGLVTDYINQVGNIDRYYSCGPLPMLRAVANSLPDVSGYLSFEERMGCGVGACYACVIPTNTPEKYKKICQDGPVIATNEVKL